MPHAYVPRVPAAIHARASRQLVEAINILHRLVDHQDDACDFGHHGQCQTHFTDGSEPGKCGVAEARAWLAEHDTAAG
jgi:hypothetical protein